MASVFSHAFFAASLGTVMTPQRRGVVALGALAAVVPDADVIGFSLGIPYAHVLGHRGLSHSIAFAACLAAWLAWVATRRDSDLPVTRVGTYLLLAIASHGVLDALTDGGLGVAFFAPFSSDRYFFPWRPIAVSPISLRRFFTYRAVAVLTSELAVVWMPALLITISAAIVRRWRSENRG